MGTKVKRAPLGKLTLPDCWKSFGIPVAQDPDLDMCVFWNESLTFNVCYALGRGLYENIDCFTSSKTVDYMGAVALAKAHLAALCVQE